MPRPTWNAPTEASSADSRTEACTSSGTPCTDATASGCFSASATALATAGRASAAAPTSFSSFELNDAATTAPTAAIATSPATRAIALLTPEAIPALLSSASASTVEVSGATVIDRPSPNTSSPGSTSLT